MSWWSGIVHLIIAVEKPKPINASRSSSFDNGMAAPYLSGQWPKDGHWQPQKDSNTHYLPIGVFAADKQTQVLQSFVEHNLPVKIDIYKKYLLCCCASLSFSNCVFREINVSCKALALCSLIIFRAGE